MHRTKRLKKQMMNSKVSWCFTNEAKQGVQKRIVLIYRNEPTHWTAQCLSLPGCSAFGATKGEALINIHEEIRKYLGELTQRKLPIPMENFDAAVVEIY